MCEHPRCGKTSKYRLKNTEYGKKIELCEYHGPIYHAKEGGELLELGKDIDPDERR